MKSANCAISLVFARLTNLFALWPCWAPDATGVLEGVKDTLSFFSKEQSCVGRSTRGREHHFRLESRAIWPLNSREFDSLAGVSRTRSLAQQLLCTYKCMPEG